MSLLTAIPAAKLWCQQIADISQITFVVSEAPRCRKERANNWVQSTPLCILKKPCKNIFFVEVEQAQCTCSFCHMSYVSLLNMSICKSARENWLEWELEGRKMWRDRRKPSLKRDNLFSSPDERQSFLTRDNGLGLEVICEATNHWHLTPPKCDGRALTNQTEIWPNFPLYICQIYCQSLDWFLLLGHKETE